MSLPLSFTSIVNRDCRSTNVAMCVLFDPEIKSPSQWPGTGAVLDLGRPLADGYGVDDPASRLIACACLLGSPHHPSRPQMRNEVLVECPACLDEESSIDRFVGYLHIS